VTNSQYAGETQTDGSFWANSFVRGSNGHNYYIACHVQDYASDIEGALQSYRAAILDVTDPSFYLNFVKIGLKGSPSFWDDDGNFHASFDGLGMEATSSEDPLQGLRMWTSLEGIEYDLTWNFSSPAVLNGALGSYLVGGELGFEWSLPKVSRVKRKDFEVTHTTVDT
jgi:kievitone hydratase